jgi:hypothetical protein
MESGSAPQRFDLGKDPASKRISKHGRGRTVLSFSYVFTRSAAGSAEESEKEVPGTHMVPIG